MQEKAPVFQTENPHSSKFDRFDNSRLFSRLQNKFTPKPYWQQYRTLRIVALAASYLFNVLSAATAAVLVYFFLEGLTGSQAAAAVLTAAALGIFEIAKRETTGRAFASYFQFRRPQLGLFAVVVLLSGLSITSSYFGSQRAVHEFTPPPLLVTQDSISKALEARLTAIDAQIADAKRTTWKGKMTQPAQRIVERLTNQREQLTAALLDREKRVQDGNDHTEQIHQADTTSTGVKFALFTLLAELLFLLCAGWLQYYDYRSYVEYCEQGEDDTPNNGNGYVTNVKPEFSFSRNRKDQPITAHIPVKDSSVSNSTVKYNATVTPPATGTQKECLQCGNAYTPKVSWQKFCSQSCKEEHHAAKHGGTKFSPGKYHQQKAQT